MERRCLVLAPALFHAGVVRFALLYENVGAAREHILTLAQSYDSGGEELGATLPSLG